MSEIKVPSVYIAATRQNDGKTTSCIGLMSIFKQKYDRLGFIKPVGQRHIIVDGYRIDEDAVLMREVYGCDNDLPSMSPVAVDRLFTRRYIEDPQPKELEKNIIDHFNEINQKSDFTVVEGTGHAGVGAVFDLDNARVAELLGTPVILVSRGGIGRPIDEIALNQAMFQKHGVRVAGVIVNKVKEEKLDQVEYYLRKSLTRMGLPLLGVIPHQKSLLDPKVFQVVKEVDGEVLNGKEKLNNFVQSIIVALMTPHNALGFFKANSLIVTPGDRDDILTAISLAASPKGSDGQAIAGIVLTGGLNPRPEIMESIKKTDIPVILSQGDTYTVTSKLHDMMVKIKPGEVDKINTVKKIYNDHIDIDLLMEQIS